MKAVIFDMDGVISDTQVIHARFESELFRRHGIEISPEEMSDRYAGVSGRVYFKSEFDRHGIDADIDALVEEKWAMLADLDDDDIVAVPGSVELIGSLKDGGFRLAVASASRRVFVERVLSVLGVLDSFDAIATSQEVEHGKPDPGVFLLAAERLGAKPADCVVIEDGKNGMVAARRAGMKCIGLVPDTDHEKYPADLLVPGLDDLTVDRIEELLG